LTALLAGRYAESDDAHIARLALGVGMVIQRRVASVRWRGDAATLF
jgi:hypothetical protein